MMTSSYNRKKQKGVGERMGKKINYNQNWTKILALHSNGERTGY